jgi:hypothetical protein
VWFDRCWLVTIRVHKDGRATGAPAGPDVSPSIAYKVTIGKSDVVLDGSGVQHAWAGLTAGATIGVVVVADADVVEGEHLAQVCMEGFDLFSRGETSDDIGLVRHEDKEKSGAMQAVERIGHAWENLKIGQRERRLSLTSAEDLPVDHAVAIQKDCSPHAVDSHLVLEVLTIGCDTSRCQITAWKASV